MHVKTLKLYRSLHILSCPRYVSCKLLALIRALVPAFTFPYTALPTTYSTWTAVVDSRVAYDIWYSLSFNNIDNRTNCYHSSARDDSWHLSPVSSFVLQYILWKHCTLRSGPAINIVLPCHQLGEALREGTNYFCAYAQNGAVSFDTTLFVLGQFIFLVLNKTSYQILVCPFGFNFKNTNACFTMFRGRCTALVGNFICFVIIELWNVFEPMPSTPMWIQDRAKLSNN